MIKYPCFMISSNGMRDSVSLEETSGIGRYLGREADGVTARDIIKSFIRSHPDTNGLPLFYVSDHGNVSRMRRITLRKGMQA